MRSSCRNSGKMSEGIFETSNEFLRELLDELAQEELTEILLKG